MADFDEHELAVLKSVAVVGGVNGRDWFRSDKPELKEAFDRLAAKHYILPEYHLAPDVEAVLKLAQRL